MSDQQRKPGLPKLDSASLEALSELERNTPDAVKQQRAHERVSIRCKVVAEPGNASDRLSMKVQGLTGDLSTGGCQVLFPVPVGVGDLYRLSFDRSMVDTAPIYVRCMRCRVVRDDAYEVGFLFFQPMDLEAALRSGEGPGGRAVA